MSKALDDVIAERKKQIARGFDAKHDVELEYLGRSTVAGLYLLDVAYPIDYGTFEKYWPFDWGVNWWRREKTDRENLVKAAALVLAEIEAIDNAEVEREDVKDPEYADEPEDNSFLTAIKMDPAAIEALESGTIRLWADEVILDDYWYPSTNLRETDFLDELRDANVERANLWPGNRLADDLFRGIELCEEAGEVAGAVKKLHRADQGIAGNTKNRESYLENLKEEIGDVMICLDRIASLHGIDIEEVTRKKFNATSVKVGLDVFL